MNRSVKTLIIKALEQYHGNDLARARLAFRRYTTEQMNTPCGDSGLTRADYIIQLEARELAVNNAIDVVGGL